MRPARYAGFAVVLGVALLLTGCTPESEIRAQLTPDGRTIEFAVCNAIEATQIVVNTTTDADAVPDDEVWNLAGSTDLTSGFILQYGLPPEGMKEKAAAVPWDDDWASIYISLKGDTGSLQTATFDTAQLSTDGWINEVGVDLGDTPCS
jgi:hypothetical protein